jgi:uncharacterized protein
VPESVHVNFGKPIPLFPLDSVTLLPQQVLPLHIFEPRYRQMIEHALDGAGLVAMAIFEGADWKSEYHGRPPIKPIVCVGHIVQHEKTPDGRYNLLLQGVCRARILRELPPSEDRLYRAGYLEPFGVPGAMNDESTDEADEDSEDDTSPEHDVPTESETGLPPPLKPPPPVQHMGAELPLEEGGQRSLDDARERITKMLSDGPLSKLVVAEPVLEYLRNEEIPSHAILELVAFPLTSDNDVRYELLAEGDPAARARIILRELTSLERLLRLATAQHPERWPKGLSWN